MRSCPVIRISSPPSRSRPLIGCSVISGRWRAMSNGWKPARTRGATKCPLGSGALAGTPYPIDRHALAESLGFRRASPNSLDAVADRDHVAEFMFAAALIGTHLSRLAEDLIIFANPEFWLCPAGRALQHRQQHRCRRSATPIRWNWRGAKPGG